VTSVRLIDRTGIEGGIDGVLHGVIGFASDRCQLDVDQQRVLGGHGRMVLAGRATYHQLEDGRWTFQEGPPGTRGFFHPRAMLEALVLAYRSASKRWSRAQCA
jgi:hypothetical protein